MNTALKTPFYVVKPIKGKKRLHNEIMNDVDITKARSLAEIISGGKYAKFTENR